MPLSPRAGLALAALAALSLAAARPAAAQTTITFDDLSDNGSGTPIANGYQGLNWSNFYVLNTNQFPVPSGYQPGTVSGTNVAYNGGVPEAINSVTPGSTFTLNSGYFTAAWHDNLNLTVTALHNGLTVFSKSVTLSATAPTLVNFDFTGVDQVNFDSSGGTPPRGLRRRRHPVCVRQPDDQRPRFGRRSRRRSRHSGSWVWAWRVWR